MNIVEVDIERTHRQEFQDLLDSAYGRQVDALPKITDETLVDPETLNPQPDVDREALRAAYYKAADEPESVMQDVDILFELQDALAAHEDQLGGYTASIPQAVCGPMADKARALEDAATPPSAEDSPLAQRYRTLAEQLEQSAETASSDAAP
jgi:HAMP domain-containing protein